jgi:hypothetical protein
MKMQSEDTPIAVWPRFTTLMISQLREAASVSAVSRLCV